MKFEGQSQPVLLTIGTCNHRAGIFVVADTFLQHHPNGRVFICLVDRPAGKMPPLGLPGTVFFADELELPGGRRFLFKYEAFELCCALKPLAIRHVIQQHEISRLIYLDSDIVVLHRFWSDLEAAWVSHSILLTPHLNTLPTEIGFESQRSLVQHGAYNGGFIAAKQGNETERFIDCWSKMLDNGCTVDPMNNIYVDQRWLDLLATSSASVGTLRNPGLNVAYWNLHERHLERSGDGLWQVDGKPVQFFHFSGFDRRQLTIKVVCSDPLALLLAEHYDELLDNAGEKTFRSFPYGWGDYCDGTAISPRHRDLILARQPELAEVENPFTLPEAPKEWHHLQRLAATCAPVRISQRFVETKKATDLIERLYRHPVLGPIWRLWTRFVNPSLKPYLPPDVRS